MRLIIILKRRVNRSHANNNLWYSRCHLITSSLICWLSEKKKKAFAQWVHEYIGLARLRSRWWNMQIRLSLLGLVFTEKKILPQIPEINSCYLKKTWKRWKFPLIAETWDFGRLPLVLLQFYKTDFATSRSNFFQCAWEIYELDRKSSNCTMCFCR